MKSAATISGMVTSILESILVIRYMVLESNALLMVTVMKVHGMRARNKNSLVPSDPAVRQAVQAARRSAEKAALVPRVDEQVDGAVTAAQVAAIKAVQNQIRVFHLFQLLFRTKLDGHVSIETPIGMDLDWERRRWVIFFSVLLQKILMFVRKPMAWFGSAIEYWPNLLSENHGFISLLFNILTGRVVFPKKGSSTYRTVIGFSDPRVELDRKIKPTDKKYHAALSMMAAKLAYENESCIQSIVRNPWNMEFLGFYNCWNEYQKQFSTQAFMFSDKTGDAELIVVAFRGTEPFDAVQWCTDFDISHYQIPHNWLLDRLQGVYTFGQPRVGDRNFGEFVEQYLDKPKRRYFRFVYCNDIVPRVPFDDSALSYKHFGTCVYFNSLYKPKVMKEEPNKNYFSLWTIIPKYINAWWELIRSFLIGFVRGPEYKEGKTMRLLRLVALVFPGLAPHFPQDYNNCTRLVTSPALDKRLV
uniref:Fungal lipase-type domain-containing protein n=1 Tax=Musa acuminata subsp. malaccensis TaxID=214687 RepID=A0A804L1W2_MUSAM